jgi:multiple antibiotic resistance protein
MHLDLSLISLFLKKIIALLVLVGPVSMIPVFLATVEGLDETEKSAFARHVGYAVTISLLIAAFLGIPLFSTLGVSTGALRVGGGLIVLLLAIAMVLGKETSFKGAPTDMDPLKIRDPSLVPLVIPLLAGPAAFSYVMANSTWQRPVDLVHIVLPIVIVVIACWLTFRLALRAKQIINTGRLDLMERIAGFILSAMAVEMIAVGLRELFLLPVSA